MKTSIENILLIDDDSAVTFVYEFSIKRIDPNIKKAIKINGKQAIDYLNELNDNGQCSPNLILLDINMPIMNGWEFMEEYDQLPLKFRQNAVLIMASSSSNIDDIQKSKENENIHDYLIKPIDMEQVFEKYQKIVASGFMKTA